MAYNNLYGIYDVRDNCWLGNDKEPLTYSNYKLAYGIAIVTSKRIGRKVEARLYDKLPKIKKDALTFIISMEEALKKIANEIS